MIQVEHLSKTYDERLAVDDLSFQVQPGEILGLIGPNGAGKTTTLRTVAGILPPSEGRIVVNGHDMVRDPISAKSGLAMIFDDPALFPNLTAWEHLEFSAKVYGTAAFEEAGETLFRDFEILDRKKTLGDELSKGMQQKVCIACALVHHPKVLLLDEPLTGLDPRAIRTLYRILHERAEAGAAIVISSHLLGQFEKLCNRYLILRRGKALVRGSLEEIRASLPGIPENATLEDIFFHATESDAAPDRPAEPPENAP